MAVEKAPLMDAMTAVCWAASQAAWKVDCMDTRVQVRVSRSVNENDDEVQSGPY